MAKNLHFGGFWHFLAFFTDKIYGRCCEGEMDNWGCGGFVGGKTAISQYEDGFFTHYDKDGFSQYVPFITSWERGTNQGIVAFKLE